MIIPKGKKVTFHLNGALLPGTENAEILLEEDVTLSLNSQFGDLVSAGAPAALSVLGGVSRDVLGFGFSGQYKQLGFQVWQKTEPLSVSITVAFNMKTNAYKDVVAPTRALIKLPLPDDAGMSSDGVGLIPPGPSILQALGSEDTENNYASGKKIACRMGFIRLPSVIITRAEPTFSKETDQFGYPVYAKIRMEIRTIFTATTGLIDQLGYPAEEDRRGV
jgi:hypothetical protein